MTLAPTTPEADRHTLLISCPDARGIIAQVSRVLADSQLNIVENAEFVDPVHHRFFMRTQTTGKTDWTALEQKLRATLSAPAHIELRSDAPRRMIIFATREHHCLGDLLLRHAFGELNAQLIAVVSQFEDLRSLAERFGIPFHVVPTTGLTREAHEKRVAELIAPFKPDLLVLAKYMRVLTPAFVALYPEKILNIHHSFLPAFIGKQPYHDAYERGVKLIGATAHFVNDALDEGPIITQNVIPVTHAQTPEALARAGRDVESVVLAKALKLVLENRVMVDHGRTLIFE